MSNLEIAQQNYPQGTEFLTATENISIPLTVTFLREAEHRDRKNEMLLLKNKVIKTWLEISPKSKKINKNHPQYTEFKEKTEQLYNRYKYLKNLENDIINEEGGIIYNGETQLWAKKV